MVNQKYGNWHFKLTRDNDVPDDIDSTPEVKIGYHPLGACYDVLQTVEQ
ncbi:N-acylglucosamine 2-epimerase [Halorhabdus tiamatea]|nr:N-acylglucosamine 2-epimerase [Halorhabdus tiamatea]